MFVGASFILMQGESGNLPFWVPIATAAAGFIVTWIGYKLWRRFGGYEIFEAPPRQKYRR